VENAGMVTGYGYRVWVPDSGYGYRVAGTGSTSFPGSLGKTLVSAGHVPRPKLIARGGVVKVSNYKQLKT
jgi:hypothetical protein